MENFRMGNKEFHLIEIDESICGLFSDHDLARPIDRWKRYGSPSPAETFASLESLIVKQKAIIANLFIENKDLKAQAARFQDMTFLERLKFLFHIIT